MSNCNNCSSLTIALSHISIGLVLTIDAKKDNTLFACKDAEQEGEAKYQLVEGCFYDYEFSDPNYIFKTTECIQAHSRNKHIGIIAPNIYVGTLTLEIIHKDNTTDIFRIKLEVQSIKSDYRSDYRYMLESITERCTDLIMQIDSPINQHFETDFNKNPETLYQRFSFVKSLIDSIEFEEAIQKIVSNPTTKWEEEHEVKDIRRIRRFNQKNIKQLVTKSNRMELSSDHFLNKDYGLTSIPTKIDSTRKTESIDTAENRFIKHALEEFLFFCENCELKFEKYSTAKFESGLLATKISTLLNQSFFKQISRPTSLKLNSPVLQRKSGYREVLNAWLKFDLAAKLIWKGGDNVYDAGKKDIATLYEYWLFFSLLDLLKEVFEIEPKSIAELIQYDKGQLSLNLKQGTAIAMKGVFKSPSRNLNIQFSYNRSFGGGKTFPNSGSYTTTLRPDYTLSIWPEEITEAKDAERTELITHIHFDAKYKVKNFYELISKSKEEELTEEENIELINEEAEEVKKGTFKNQDLLKMHAYKDAIRRTGGAYVLYPGEGKSDPFRGFHELIPGLGAFVIKPNKEDIDKEHLKTFIRKVIANFIDRASQREHTAIKVYDIHQKNKLDSDTLNEPLPEYISNKKLIPSETFVLVGYYKDDIHLSWIKEEGYYNVRYGEKYSLSTNEISAQYLLLYSKDQTESTLFFKLKSNGAKVFTKSELKKDLKYKTTPSQEMYLVYQLEEECEKEFNNLNIDLTKLDGLSENKRPIAISIEKLMNSKIK
jgi:predicted component of viral defense system (DUF524 family)